MIPSHEKARSFGRRSDLHQITIVHGDRVRAFHVDTRLLTTVAVVAAAFVTAYLGATGYLFVRDDVIADQLGRKVRLERTYEDRVAALRAEIDRINARQLMDQDAFEAKLETLLERQTKLGETQAKVSGLVARIGDLGLALPAAAGKPQTAAAPLAPPAGPPTGSIAPVAPPVPPAPLDTERFSTPLRTSWFSPFATPAHAAEGRDPAARIASVERSIDQFERQQSAAVTGLVEFTENRSRSWSRALERVGFRVSEPAPKPVAALPAGGGEAVGGPFVPLPPDPLTRAESAVEKLSDIRSVARRLPFARPLPGDRVVTSEFGARLDPFLGIGALHTGIDFRAEMAEPIRATGPGVVIAAGRQGGYGLCVDVDHGNGVVTRYGHMSSITVAPGEKLKTGDTVGLAGSTGRSTGTHLHYETRVAGEAVDPRTWLDAGRALGF